MVTPLRAFSREELESDPFITDEITPAFTPYQEVLKPYQHVEEEDYEMEEGSELQILYKDVPAELSK